jgi:hypothetical protein
MSRVSATALLSLPDGRGCSRRRQKHKIKYRDDGATPDPRVVIAVGVVREFDEAEDVRVVLDTYSAMWLYR